MFEIYFKQISGFPDNLEASNLYLMMFRVGLNLKRSQNTFWRQFLNTGGENTLLTKTSLIKINRRNYSKHTTSGRKKTSAARLFASRYI